MNILPLFLGRKVRQASNQQKQAVSSANLDQLGLNMEAVFTSERSDSLQTIWHDNPDDRTLHIHIKSSESFSFYNSTNHSSPSSTEVFMVEWLIN
jgi:hypothetical protein